MSQIGDIERITQNRVVKFFCDNLHYTYLGDLHDSENSNIMQERLYAYLSGKAGYSDKLAHRAIDMLVRTSANLQHGLYDANKEVYRLLKYGAKVAEDAGEAEKTVYFINFDDPLKNDFAIAEEVTVVGNNTKRPDLVVYVNGIALAVIELKRSSVSVAEGIRQNLTNQKTHFIENFFTTVQFCMAGNDSEGLRYGTLLTPEKHYLEWQNDGFAEFPEERNEIDVLIEEKSKNVAEKLDRQLFAMFCKKRFLDLIHNFIIFDKGIKKVCRYNQYYAIKLVSRLIRAYAEIKPRMDDAGYSSAEQNKLGQRVNTYIKLRDVIGRASGDFLDYKQYEPGMRYLIDNYIVAEDAEKVAMLDDFTLLDFILAQENKLNKDGNSKEQESAAEAIENNIRKKVVQKIVINPAYYSKMSEVLEQLILDRKRGVIAYKQLLERYLELAKNVSNPEENERYPVSIRNSGAMRAFYDNCGENEELAVRLHNVVLSSKLDSFRNNPVKENRIKHALFQIMEDDEMVERLYKIVVEQEEY